MSTRLLLLEDDPAIARTVAYALERDGLQVTHCLLVQDARQQMQRHPFDLLVLDVGLPDGNGTALIAALRAQDATMGILVISAWSTEEAILQALRAGATGYLLKERDDLEVMLSIRSVLRGGAPIDPFIARRVMIEFQQQPASPAVAPMAAASEDDALSPREIDILQQVANGLSHRETAERLHISRHTVEAHIRNIYRKLSVNSRLRAITEARARGLMD